MYFLIKNTEKEAEVGPFFKKVAQVNAQFLL